MEFYQGDTVSESFQFTDPDGLNIMFTAGTNEPTVGDTVTDGTATAILTGFLLLEGSWAGNDAVGKLYLADQVGSFSGGTITIDGGNNIGTIAGNSSEYLNLTDYSILFTGKSSNSLDDYNAEFRCGSFAYPNLFQNITVDTAATGEITLKLSYLSHKAGTQGKVGSYNYDFLVYYEDSGDKVTDIKTLNQSNITCKQDVTRESGL